MCKHKMSSNTSETSVTQLNTKNEKRTTHNDKLEEVTVTKPNTSPISK